MFPRMRTSSTSKHSTPNTQTQTCSLECALHQQPTLNTQHLNTKHVHSNAHFINTKHSTPNIQTQTCSPKCALHQHQTFNSQHPNKQTCSLWCALHHYLTFNTQHLSQHLHIIITQHSTP